jgi:type IV secretory pathway VirJ component
LGSHSRFRVLIGVLAFLVIALLLRVQAESSRYARDLPVTEVEATGADSGLFAVMISGDGGWARLDRELSAQLASRGVPVAGLSSLRYFWRARTPDEAAADVSRVIEQYAVRWHRPRVLLIGYSFGADVMPAIFNRLTPASRARVASISLLGVAHRAAYEVSASEWLPFLAEKGDAVLPEVRKLGAARVLCVQGAGETHSLCPELRPLGIEVRQIGQGHHFSYLDAALADAVLSAARV